MILSKTTRGKRTSFVLEMYGYYPYYKQRFSLFTKRLFQGPQKKGELQADMTHVIYRNDGFLVTA